MAVKRKHSSQDLQTHVSTSKVKITPLGAGQEVGRSCILLEYLGKTVMLDCGVHPGHTGLRSLPFWDDVAMDKVDIMLVTHFHLDHCAAVPYIVGKTSFKGRIFMTHPTKAITGALLKDFVRVSRSGEESLYSEADLDKAMEATEVIDFHQTINVDGIKITPYRAGHVLGAAMFMVEIAGTRVLYTGDYSRLPDRHMPGADMPEETPDVVIVESTYGVSRHLPRSEREQLFLQKVHRVVSGGGRLLLPVVALGRAQELLLILEEYWAAHPELQRVPVYQASGLARRSLSFYQTYLEMMNDDIKRASQVSNPFVFKHITHLSSLQHMDSNGPCVVMATPSMLQSGLSRELFEAWCEDGRNGLIIADFAVQGTLAHEVLSQPKEVMTRAGVKVPLRMSVDAISFSAHADFAQTSEFLDTLRPPHVVLVHGEANEMLRLKRALEQRAGALNIARQVYNPAVTQAVEVECVKRYTAQMVGGMASDKAARGAARQGLLVRRDFKDRIMLPADLPAYTKLHPGSILQRQTVALARPFNEVRLALEVVFEGMGGSGDLGLVSGSGEGGKKGVALRIADAVALSHSPGEARSGNREYVTLEWEGGTAADLVADAVVAVLMQNSGEPSGLSQAEQARRDAASRGDTAVAEAAELSIAAALLSNQFGPAVADQAMGCIRMQVEEQQVVIEYKSHQVVGTDEATKARIQSSLARMKEAWKACQF